jgi:hypothetical protein
MLAAFFNILPKRASLSVTLLTGIMPAHDPPFTR